MNFIGSTEKFRMNYTKKKPFGRALWCQVQTKTMIDKIDIVYTLGCAKNALFVYYIWNLLCLAYTKCLSIHYTHTVRQTYTLR